MFSLQRLLGKEDKFFSLLEASAQEARTSVQALVRLGQGADQPVVLDEFGYGDVSLDSPLHEDQLRQTHSVLMGLDDDALLKPFRAMIGQPSPGEDLGGWYRYDPNFDWHTFDSGFAPTSTFGQWVSALSRAYAITGSQAAREKVLRLNRLYAQVIGTTNEL